MNNDNCFNRIIVNETLMAVCASVIDTAWQNHNIGSDDNFSEMFVFDLVHPGPSH
jgi:hypothetical protein